MARDYSNNRRESLRRDLPEPTFDSSSIACAHHVKDLSWPNWEDTSRGYDRFRRAGARWLRRAFECKRPCRLTQHAIEQIQGRAEDHRIVNEAQDRLKKSGATRDCDIRNLETLKANDAFVNSQAPNTAMSLNAQTQS